MVYQKIMIYKIFYLFLVISIVMAPANAETSIIELQDFLGVDATDQNEWTLCHSCGHFTRELAHNSSEYNITLGAAILGNHPVFRGYQSHIVNYIKIDGILYFVEPQTDNIMLLEEVFMLYQYIRLYPDGTQVPSNWKHNLAPSLRYDAH